MKWDYALPESESSGNMSIVILLFMEWKYTLPNSNCRSKSALVGPRMNWNYALPDNREWWEQVNLDGVTNEMELRTAWELEVEGHISHNCAAHEMGIRTRWVKSGRNISAMMVQLNENTHPLSQWQEQVSHDCAAHEI